MSILSTYLNMFTNPAQAKQDITNWYNQQGVHIGSWGTPEFGVTEALAGSAPRTEQGGSNLLGGQQAPIPTTDINWQIPKEGDVAPDGSVFRNGQWVRPSGTTGTTGDGQVQGTATTGTTIPTFDDINQQIDAIYGPSMNYLGQAEQQLRSDYPSVQGDISSQFQTSKEQLELGQQQAGNVFTQAGTQAKETKENALAAARRLYNELRMGTQQRFGGASSAGQFVSELQGREFQRSMAGQEREYANTINKISMKRTEIETQYKFSLYALDREKTIALNEAKRDFDNKLLELKRLGAETESAKAHSRFEALQELRNQIYQINLQNQQFQQTLATQRQANLDQLTNFGDSATASQNQAKTQVSTLTQSPYMTTGPQTAYAITSGRQAPAQTYTGQISRYDDEDLFA